MQGTRQKSRGPIEYPPIPELTWSPRNNLEETKKLVQKNYPQAWEQAHAEIGRSRDNGGITGIIGRVNANVARMRKVEGKHHDPAALGVTTHEQIDSAIEKTHDFLDRWWKKPQEKLQVNAVRGFWDNKLETEAATFQGEGSAADFELSRAESVNGIWHDITVMQAVKHAKILREKLIQTRDKSGLPGVK